MDSVKLSRIVLKGVLFVVLAAALLCGCVAPGEPKRALVKGKAPKITYRVNEKTGKIEAFEKGKVVDREYVTERARKDKSIVLKEEAEKTEAEALAEKKREEAVEILEGEKINDLKEILEEQKDGALDEEEEAISILMAPPIIKPSTTPQFIEPVPGTFSHKRRIKGADTDKHDYIELYYRLKYLPVRTASRNPAERRFVIINSKKVKDYFDDAVAKIKKVITFPAKGEPGEGIVGVDPYPNSDMIVIRTTEEEMAVVEELLRYVVDVPLPQVRISAIVSEIIDSDDFQFGFYYSIIGKSDSTTTNIFEGLTFNLPPQNFFDLVVAPGAPINRFQGGAITFSTAPTSEGSRLEELTFRALVDIRKAEIVSRPSLTVELGQTAVILTGEQVPIYKSTIVNNVVTITVEFKEVGVKLYITPLSISKDTVRLHLVIEISESIGFTDPMPLFPSQPKIRTRYVDDTVYVRDGQKLLIAGLTTSDTFDASTGIPLLKDIPLIGYLFKSVSKFKRNTELMFLITPEIEPTAEVEPEYFLEE